MKKTYKKIAKYIIPVTIGLSTLAGGYNNYSVEKDFKKNTQVIQNY